MKTTLLAMVVAGLVMGCAAAGSEIDHAGPETAGRGGAEMETILPSRTLRVPGSGLAIAQYCIARPDRTQ
jgi:hypothetical protein